jgi:hypothetical protein
MVNNNFKTGNKRSLNDYIFWILLILLTNPGGIQETFGIDQFGRLNLIDFIFPLLTICYLLASDNAFYKDKITQKVQVSLLFFVVYYFLVFGYITPQINNSNSNFISDLIKMRWAIYSFTFFFYVIRFWRRSWRLFLKLFLFSSLIILSIFIFQVITGIELLKLKVYNRSFINLDRYMLYKYGLMYFITSLGIVVIVFRFKGKYRNFFILGLLLMTVTWFLSVTRRQILGISITLFIAIVLYQFIYIKKTSRSIRMIFRTAFIISLIVVSAYYILPAYFKSSGKLLESSIKVARYGEDLTGIKDTRMELFGQAGIMAEFKKSPFFGTGFNLKWRNEAVKKSDMDSSDYPFQAALAMFGIIGLLFFLPVYLYLIIAIIKDILYLKRNKINIFSLSDMILLAFVISNIYGLLQYMNWFGSISNLENIGVLLSLGQYFSAREVFYAERELQFVFCE